MRYDSGPMGYLSDQIMKEMQRAGYPAMEFNLYRDTATQLRYLARGTSRAGAFRSAHQFYGAADIIHEKYAWFATGSSGIIPPDGSHFWDCLWDCVAVVSERHDIEFSPRLTWDPAHIQIHDWREFKAICGPVKPSQEQLNLWFNMVLPKVWKAYLLREQSR